MKLSQIGAMSSINTGFKGHWEDYQTSYNNHNITASSSYHSSSSIEKTLGTFRTYPKYKVYFADPMEFVPDTIRENADYIVYDNEPQYPDVHQEVSKNYFGRLRVNFAEHYQNIKDYFERLIAADQKAHSEYEQKFLNGVDSAKSKEKADYYQARIQESEHKKEIANECQRLYYEGGHLRYVKETLEDELSNTETDSRRIRWALEVSKKELDNYTNAKNGITSIIESLKNRIGLYKKLENELYDQESKGKVFGENLYDTIESQTSPFSGRHSDSYNEHIRHNKYLAYGCEKPFEQMRESHKSLFLADIEEHKDVNQKIKSHEARLQIFEEKRDDCVKAISDIEKYITLLGTKLKDSEEKINKLKPQIEEVKAKLIPLFDKLKYFYETQGIRSLKR